jgi:hypothetical protein
MHIKYGVPIETNFQLPPHQVPMLLFASVRTIAGAQLTFLAE